MKIVTHTMQGGFSARMIDSIVVSDKVIVDTNTIRLSNIKLLMLLLDGKKIKIVVNGQIVESFRDAI